MVRQQNGLLSFANPNYRLDPSDINSNPEPSIEPELTDDPYDELYEELDAVCRFSSKSSNKNRRSYAKLDISSMGIDLNSATAASAAYEHQPLLADSENNLTSASALPTSSSSSDIRSSLSNNNNEPDLAAGSATTTMGRRNGFLDYYLSLETATRQRNGSSSPVIQQQDGTNSKQRSRTHSSEEEPLNHPSHNPNAERDDDDDIPHIHGNLTDDLYALPTKRRPKKSSDHNSNNQQSLSSCKSSYSDSNSVASSGKQSPDSDQKIDDEILPIGWEKHEDEDGPYYWHICSGTIQREPPSSNHTCMKSDSRRNSRDIDSMSGSSPVPVQRRSFSSSSSTASSDSDHSGSHKSSNMIKRRSYQEGTCSLTPDKKPIRFAVRSLGWLEIAEEDLTPERSSKAVNKCIVDLSLGRNDILDVVGRWGDVSSVCPSLQDVPEPDGKDLFMDLDDYCLRLTDPQDLTVLNTQPIHTIRVWGVGRDNGRDFAYVARDRATGKHKCHVFRCDIPARIIANTLRDICKKIMIERSLQQNMARPVGPNSQLNQSAINRSSRGGAARPTNLPTEQRRFNHSTTRQSFPTPMEEPKKVLKAHYLGTLQVAKATGIETLNAAIDKLVAMNPPEQYKYVNIAVAPSTITVLEAGENGKQLAECRVRFLSFLGIGRNVKHCGFIVHTAQDHFVAYVFHCEPSSGALCKTIEAACKLRYQKCLDAHKEVLERRNAEARQNKGLSTTLKSVLGSLSSRLSKVGES